MHTSRHTRKNSSFSTQDEHLVLLGLKALTDAPNLSYATRSNYRNGSNTLGASTSYEKPQRIEGVIVPCTLRKSGLLIEFWLLQR